MVGPADNLEVVNELRRIRKLLGLILVEGKPQNEKIGLLANAEFSSSQIGEVLGISATTVRVAQHQARKKVGKRMVKENKVNGRTKSPKRDS